MAYTQNDLDNITDLIAAGEGSTTVDGRTVVYRSLDDLLRIKRDIKEALAQTKAPRRRRSALGSHFHTRLDRGLG